MKEKVKPVKKQIVKSNNKKAIPAKIKNKKGILHMFLGAPVAILFITTVIGGRAILETAMNGTLKKNGQTVWCKMQNKGNDFCDGKTSVVK